MQSDFQTVFDLAEVGYKSWTFPAIGLVFVAVGVALVFAPNLADSIFGGGFKGRGRRVFAWVYFLFATTWVVGTFGSTYAEYANLMDHLKRGDYQVVEGVVEHFDPMPYGGHKNETFDVAGAHFAYSDYVVTAGFNNTSSHGGPIREGLFVRIRHVNGTIIRLEIRR